MSATKRAELSLRSRTGQTGGGSPTEPSAVKITPVYQTELLAAWTVLQRKMRRALKKSCGDRMTEEGLLKGLFDERYFLWIAHEGDKVLGGVIFSFVRRPVGRCLQVVMLGGEERDRWKHEMNAQLHAHAVKHDCYCMEAMCRDGVVKVLEGMGWKRKATVMELR